MTRDEQIQALKQAEKRIKDRFATWTENPKLKTSLRRSSELIRDLKVDKASERV